MDSKDDENSTVKVKQYFKMDGPFTCEQLRSIRQVAIDHEFNMHTNSIVENIKQQILNKAIGDVSDPRRPNMDYCHDRLPSTQYSVSLVELAPIRGYGSRMAHLFDRRSVIDTVIAKLKNVFPDMKIVIDPLRTYILFDWSV